MRVSRQAALFFWPAFVVSGVIPPLKHEPLPPASVEDKTPEAAVLWQSEAHSSVRFETPCHNCFIGVDDSLLFDLTVERVDAPCGVSHVKLNGQPLFQEWDEIDAWGSGTISTQLKSGLGNRDIAANWQSSCLFDTIPQDGSNSHGDDVAQILTFTIHQVGIENVEETSGFTVSFKQRGHPEILRLDATPLHISHNASFTESWRNPPPELLLASNSKHVPPPPFISLEAEIKDLQSLLAQVAELKWQIKDRKFRIAQIMRQDVQSTIKNCDGIRCVFQTLIHEGPRLFHVITNHFQGHLHDHHHHSPPRPMRPAGHRDGPGHMDDHRPDGHPHGPPHPNPRHPPPHRHPDGPPPPHFSHPPLHRRALFHTLKAAKAVALFIGIASIISYIFRKCMCSPRVKVDRTARREERRNERAYRRAARRHRWSQWWSRYRRPRSTEDYEEKRHLILNQEDRLEDSMQMEIAALRHAHELVADLVQAEEGRMYDPVISYPPAELDGGVHTFHRTNSLPEYRSDAGTTEPPGYEEELGDETAVADGFQYTPVTASSTGSSVIRTPESSVISISPRMSVETGRTTISRDGATGTVLTKD